MYFEFESIPTAMESMMSSPTMVPMSGLSRRHRRLSSSTQSLRELIDSENCLENITPSHCDLYLITRKKLSQINTNTVKQSHDLRREVLLTSIHRNITSKSTASPTISPFSINELTASSPTLDSSLTTTQIRDRLESNDSQPMIINSDQQFKYVNPSATTTTSTTTIASASSSTRLMTTSSTRTTPSAIKKRNLVTTPSLPNSDYEEEWKTTIKRLKVVHGIDGFDVSMDSEFDSGYCDNDLNDLTNNFHSLKTPFT